MKQWHILNQKWQVLSQRERWMIFAAGLLAVVGLMDTFLLEPQRLQVNEAQLAINKWQNDTAALTEKITQLANQAAPQPGGNVYQQQMNDMQQRLAEQSAALVKVSQVMVAPEEMVSLLKKLLQKHPDIQMLEMQSLPVVDFISEQRKRLKPAANAEATATANLTDEAWNNLPHIYQHGVKVTLKGSYSALTAYAQSLKAIGRTLAWESATLKGDYPESELSFQVYTLSGEHAWLGI